MVPRLTTTIFRHIEFVRLSSRQVLAVFVTQSGLVQNKLVETDEDLTASELEQITNYLNQTMTGLIIQEKNKKIVPIFTAALSTLPSSISQEQATAVKSPLVAPGAN